VCQRQTLLLDVISTNSLVLCFEGNPSHECEQGSDTKLVDEIEKWRINVPFKFLNHCSLVGHGDYADKIK